MGECIHLLHLAYLDSVNAVKVFHHVCFLFAADARSDGAIATIAGGVVGGLVGVVLVAVIAVLIVIILKNKKSSQYGRSISQCVCVCTVQ